MVKKNAYAPMASMDMEQVFFCNEKVEVVAVMLMASELKRRVCVGVVYGNFTTKLIVDPSEDHTLFKAYLDGYWYSRTDPTMVALRIGKRVT